MLYSAVCAYLKREKQSAMPYRQYMIALGKLQDKGIIINNDGYVKLNKGE